MWKQSGGLRHRSDIARLTLCLLVQQNQKPQSKITGSGYHLSQPMLSAPSSVYSHKRPCHLTPLHKWITWMQATSVRCYQRIGDAYKIKLKAFLVLQKIIYFLNSFKNCYFLHNFSACAAYFVMVCITDLFWGEWKCLVRHYLIYITFRVSCWEENRWWFLSVLNPNLNIISSGPAHVLSWSHHSDLTRLRESASWHENSDFNPPVLFNNIPCSSHSGLF